MRGQGRESRDSHVAHNRCSTRRQKFGKESRFGIPFTFILRDILQFDSSLADAMDRISSSNRTCDLILGVGDGKLDANANAPFRGIQYSHDVANFYVDKDMQPHNDSWHARINDVVYYGMCV